MKISVSDFDANIEGVQKLAERLFAAELESPRIVLIKEALDDPEVGKKEALKLGFLLGASVALIHFQQGRILLLREQ